MYTICVDMEALELGSVVKLLWARRRKASRFEMISEEQLRLLLLASRKGFMSQSMFLELEAPITVCGDIHGQFQDLLRIFDFNGRPPNGNYVFLGDYVDRGPQSLEAITLLFAYKLLYPENFFLLRGNHETASLTRVYGFYEECKRRCSIKLWKKFCDVFNCMPVCACIEDAVLCMHGGLSPSLSSMDQIRKLVRPTEVPDVGLMCDLLWADPDPNVRQWTTNSRGVSVVFGPDIVQGFVRRHGLELICRAHQVVEDGYEFFANRKLVTLFSAPNYCGEFDNAGAVLSIDETLLCKFQILKPSSIARKE